MAILKRTQKLVIHDHVENETGHYINVKMWLSKIHKVVDIDKNVSWKLDSDCKVIYAYLYGFGRSQGWDNIYPNQVDMCDELGISISTMKRKVKLLGECGLIDIIHNREVCQFGSNRYRVKQARHVPRRKWYTVSGKQLTGKMYTFDSSVFRS